tara:strand:- start:1801 stop:2553 length:753 start_codon:yes stop_codon:yes gene_type:complete
MKKTYFNHDSSARNDIRIIKLRASLGYEGYGIFWAVLELLFSEENKICTNQYDILAYGLQCDPDKLKAVIEDFDLFVIEDGCFYSRRLNNHIEQINTKSIKAKENANKRWNNATAIQSHSDRNASKVNKSISKVNKSIEKRIMEFKNSIHSIEDISDSDKKDFFLYWTEKNKSGSKFRAEMEKTFDIGRRLKRWASNGFNKQKNRFPDHYDSLLMKRLDTSAQKEYEQHLKNLGYVTEYNPNAGAKWVKK